MLNGRNRESGAQTHARWERGRKRAQSNASVQHRLKKKKKKKTTTYQRTQKRTLRCALRAGESTFPSVLKKIKKRNQAGSVRVSTAHFDRCSSPPLEDCQQQEDGIRTGNEQLRPAH